MMRNAVISMQQARGRIRGSHFCDGKVIMRDAAPVRTVMREHEDESDEAERRE